MILFVTHFYRMKMQKMNNVVMFVIKRKKKEKMQKEETDFKIVFIRRSTRHFHFLQIYINK